MIFVCLVSRQTMPNLLHILQAKPERVVCIATKQEDESRKVLQAALRTQKIVCDPPLYVDAYAPETTLTACRQIVERYGRLQLIANLTGGTKVMSLAAFRAFSAAKVRCLYTDTQNQRLLSLYPDNRASEPLDTHIDVLTYLRANGHIAATRPASSRLSLLSLATFIGQHIAELDPFLSKLRYEVRDDQRNKSFRFSVSGKQRNMTAAEFLQRATRAGLLTAGRVGTRELEIVFKDDKARRYVEGEWLEDLVFETVKKSGFDSSSTNVSLMWKDAPEREMNEIDIAVVHNLRFFYVSCKSGSDATQIKYHLFELEALAEMAGGFFNHPILVARVLKPPRRICGGGWRRSILPILDRRICHSWGRGCDRLFGERKAATC